MNLTRALLLLSILTTLGCGGTTTVTDTGTGNDAGGTDAGTVEADAGNDAGSVADSGASDGGSTGTDAGAAGEACTNTADTEVLGTIDIAMITGDCGMMSFGAEPATTDCIETNSGLSRPCSQCFGDTVGCIVSMCLTECLADASSAACVACRAENCDPAFAACSGLTP